MQKLSGETIRLISSAQVITAVSSAVKELVENSLDANADSIDIRLENFGIEKVEIRDNGSGIAAHDATVVGQRHFTSKITGHADLESLRTYGFRGEALGSLCAVSNVVISTKTEEEEVGRCYVLSENGIVISSKMSQCGKGTTVTATRLFHNVPVRRQYYSSARRRKEELKKVEDLILGFGVVCPGVRFTLSHNKSSIWQKNKMPNLKSALLNTLGSGVMGQLTRVHRMDASMQIEIEGYLPKPESDLQQTTRANEDRTWTSVNGRLVVMKDITKVVRQYFIQAHPKAVNLRHVVMCLRITMPTSLVDVNLEPNKTKVLLQNQDAVLSLLIRILEELYTPPLSVNGQSSVQSETNHPKDNEVGAVVGDAHDESHPWQKTADEERTKSPEAQHGRGEGIHLRGECADSATRDRVCEMDMRTEGGEPYSDITKGKDADCGREVGVTDELGDSFMEPSLPNFSLMDGDDNLFATWSSNTESFVADNRTENSESKFAEAADGSNGNEMQCRSDEGKGSSPLSKEASCSLLVARDPPSSGSDSGQMQPRVERAAATWSEGRGLAAMTGEPIQPSILLIPGRPLPQNKSDRGFPQPGSLREAALPTHDQSSTQKQCPANSALPTCDQTSTEKQGLANPSLETTLPIWGRSSTEKQSLVKPGLQANTDQAGGVGDSDVIGCHQRVKVREAEETAGPGVHRTLWGVGQSAGAWSVTGANQSSSNQRLEGSNREHVIGRQHNSTVMNANGELRTQSENLTEAAHGHSKHQSKGKRAASLTHGLQVSKKKKTEKMSNQSLIDEMLASQREKKSRAAKEAEKEAPHKLEVRLTFSMRSLTEKQADEHRRAQEPDHLVGSLSGHGVWLAVKDHQLVVFNQYRAQEVLLYHRLLATHRLPHSKLPVPLPLSAGMFGEREMWLTLLGMRSVPNPVDQSRLFTDDRLVLNGFHIRQLTDPDTSEVRLEVVSMATDSIPFCGLGDLREVLEAVSLQGAQTVAQCRPAKLANYLMGEAVRMARCLPGVMGEEEVREIMEGLEGLTWTSKLCLHGKSFQRNIHVFPAVDSAS